MSARTRDPLTLALAFVLALGSVIALTTSSSAIGYARDEGVYFEASRHHAAWVVRLLREPARALRPATRDRHFSINHEHPVLMKTAAGLSARLFTTAPAKGTAEADDDRQAPTAGMFPLLREGTAMRLPAHLALGLCVFMLVLAGRRVGGSSSAGVLAGASFVALPHVAFHGSLHAFDVPVAVATLAVVLCYRRALESWRFGILVGPLLGVALATKHNALLLGPLLALHYLVCLVLAQWREGRRIEWRQLFPLPLVSMAVLGPLTAIALWPWMWHDTKARLLEWFLFHGRHSYYNTEFLGVNYNRPPLPVEYPFVLAFATVSATFLLLALAGLALWVRDDFAAAKSIAENEPSPTMSVPLPASWPRCDGVLVALMAVFPLALIALPTVPIFGGTKHWITAYPFFALAAALAWGRLWQAMPEHNKFLRVLPLALVLLPSLLATTRGHTYGLSQYAPFVGGPRGAAHIGLARGFWGYAVVPFLDEDREAETSHRAYVHDIHTLAQRQYEREGRWPAWKRTSVGQSDTALLFHEMHMLTDEVAIWNAHGTTAPSEVITLHDVPLTSRYDR